MAHITSINISEKKGTPKYPIKSVMLKEEFGLVGDAHAAPGLRQVSLLSQQDIDAFRKNPKLKVPLSPGIFGENLAISGIDFHELELGKRLQISNRQLDKSHEFGGDVIIEISKIGKECLTPCMIGQLTGDCIMPKLGVFAIVIKGGMIRVNDNVEILP